MENDCGSGCGQLRLANGSLAQAPITAFTVHTWVIGTTSPALPETQRKKLLRPYCVCPEATIPAALKKKNTGLLRPTRSTREHWDLRYNIVTYSVHE